MPVTFVSYGRSFGSHTTVTVDPPSGIVDGNLLVAFCYAYNADGIGWSPPAGWTTQGQSVTTTLAGQMAIFTRVASGEFGSYVFTCSYGGAATILNFSGVLGVDGAPAFNAVSTQVTTYVAPSVTPTALGDVMIVGYGSPEEAEPEPFGFSPLPACGGGAHQVTICCFYAPLTSTSPTGTIPTGNGGAGPMQYTAGSFLITGTPPGTTTVALGPLTVTAGGTVSGTPSGGGGATITGSAALNVGPMAVVARTSLETVTATAAVRLGPLLLFALSGRIGPGLFPVPGFRGRWRLTLHTRSFAPATLNSTIIAELVDARSRQLVQTWNTPATLTFTLDGHSQSAALVQELQQDVVAWRWDDQTGLERPVFRGPITQSQDQLTTEAHTVTYTCHDYAALLTRRLLTNTYTVTGRDQDDIVADLLAAAITARSSSGTSFAPASWLPLSLYTASPAGTLRGFSGQRRDRTYYGSQNIGTAIDDLSKVIGGFDYDIRPSAVDTTDSLRVFYPAQGVTRLDGVALQYGSTVATVQRSVDSSAYANYVRVLGNNTSANPTPQFFAEAWTPDAATNPAGLWMLDDSAAGSSVTVQATLNEKAAGDINLDALLVPSYTLGLAPDAYTWGNPNMGDTVPLYIQSGRLNVNTTVRVLGIAYSIGDDGQEDVTLTVSRPANELYQLFSKADRDTKELARR